MTNAPPIHAADAVDAADPVDAEPPYRELLLESVPRLLGFLDREELSPTRGSFDRDHWAWKFRDFPVPLLQAGLIPLAWVHTHDFDGNVYRDNAELLRWIERGIECTLERQHGNGAFDTIGPNTQDHGVTLSTVYTLATVALELGDRLSASCRHRLREGVVRACGFASRSEEDYAFISNHHALFAAAWLRGGVLVGDEDMVRRSDAAVATVIAHQSPEGWYSEYGGADPGYESLGIQYLALVRRHRPSPALDESLARALAFYAYAVHPDGSVGGGYGSRHTQLWYPGGFELLAADHPTAAAIARFVRRRLAAGQVVTPRNVDAHNLPTLLAGYASALEAVTSRPGERRGDGGGVPGALPLLPCESPLPLRVFNGSGLVVAGTPHYHAVANVRKGGMLVVFERGTGRILHEDAGYVLRAADGDWTTALVGEPVEPRAEGASIEVTTTFARANREMLTPAKFLILRILNLTLFRSVWLGALIRRMIIARIITGRALGPFRLVRRLAFASDHVAVHDEIVADDAGRVTEVWRPRSYQALHMGSARYFHPRELVSITTALDEAPPALAARLRTAGRLALSFVVTAPAARSSDSPDARPSLATAPSGLHSR